VVKIQAQSGAFQWIRSATGSVGLVLATVLICGWLTRGPGVDWKPYSEELIISARRDKRPVIIDFYADWCTPCVELEQKTFHDPKIAARSKGEFILIKVDLTRDVNPIHEHLLQQYNVRGVPTVVFIGPDGTERKELRLVDFLPAALFLSRMDALNQKDRH
jgi:thiol:disulfide interchange protein DsbD